MGCQTRRDKKRCVLWKPRWYYDRRRKTRSCMLPKEREAKIFLVLAFPQGETSHNPSSPSTLSSFQSLCLITIHLLSLCSSIQHINLVISESRCWEDLCHIPVPEFTKGWSFFFIPFGQLHISVFVIYSSYHYSSRYPEVCMYSPVSKLKSQIV